MGMYELCKYERFSMTDVAKFERRLKKWCTEACMPGKSMLVFDMTCLKIEVEPQFFRDNTGEYYEVTLPNISFTYMRIADTAMCMMYKIWENDSQKILYRLPCVWDGSELWLGE